MPLAKAIEVTLVNKPKVGVSRLAVETPLTVRAATCVFANTAFTFAINTPVTFKL